VSGNTTLTFKSGQIICFFINFKIHLIVIRYVKLGTPWATSLLGFISLAMAPIPFLFYKYGPWLRERSAFHLATIKLELEEEEARRERNVTN
jgi:hypothetical protein